jgi:dipeptidase
VAQLQDIPRDLLVEISIQRLQPIMTAEQEKHRKRILVLQEMEACQQQLQRTMMRTKKLLGKEDKATLLLEKIVRTARESVGKLAAVIEEGKGFQEEPGSP